MPWLQVTLESTRDDAPRLGDALEEAGAVSVSLEGADAEPLFETDWHDTTPGVETDARRGLVCRKTRDVPEAMAYGSRRCYPCPRCRRSKPKPLPTRTGCASGWIAGSRCTSAPISGGACELADPARRGAANIILDPGMAFGTGTHATTAMCLEWLAAHPPRNLEVIDYGCGSGILAIAATQTRRHARACDRHDPQALVVSHENAETQSGYRAARALPSGCHTGAGECRCGAGQYSRRATRAVGAAPYRLVRPGGQAHSFRATGKPGCGGRGGVCRALHPRASRARRLVMLAGQKTT